MNKGGKNNRNTVLAIMAVLVFAALAAVFYEYGKKGEGDNSGKNDQAGNIVKTEDGEEYKLSEDEYSVQIEEKDGSKVVNNEEAGVSITIPDDWKPYSVYKRDDELKLKISKTGAEQPDVPSEIIDGFMIEVYEYQNESSLSLEDWIKENDIRGYKKIKFQNLEAFEKSSKVGGQLDDNLNPTPIEDSLYKAIFVSEDNKIYEIGCSSFGEKYEEYSIQCFNSISSDLKL